MGRTDLSPAVLPLLMRNAAMAACVIFALTACQSEDEDKSLSSVAAGRVAALPEDAVILGKLYGQGSRAPAGFYVDPRSDSQTSYSIYHLDSKSILDPATSDPGTRGHELCSDDLSEALAWSEAEQSHRVLGGDLLAALEYDRYFEFIRTLSDVSDWVSYGRVFKCSYLDRRGVTAGSMDGPAGTLNRRPLGAQALQTLSEYLWTFTAFNNHAHVVLSSIGAESPTSLVHTLTMATLTPGAGSVAGCDRVELRDWELTLSKQNGALESRLYPIGAIDTRLVAGTPSRCD